MPIAVLNAAEPTDIDSRRELFVDRRLIDRMDGVRLKIHHPQPREVILTFDRPWQGLFSGYETVLKDGDAFRRRTVIKIIISQFEPEPFTNSLRSTSPTSTASPRTLRRPATVTGPARSRNRAAGCC